MAWLFDSLQMQGVVVSLSKIHYPLLSIDSTQKRCNEVSEKVLNGIQSIDTFKQNKDNIYSNLTKNGKDHFDNIVFPLAAARTNIFCGTWLLIKTYVLSTLAVYLANKSSWLKHFA